MHSQTNRQKGKTEKNAGKIIDLHIRIEMRKIVITNTVSPLMKEFNEWKEVLI